MSEEHPERQPEQQPEEQPDKLVDEQIDAGAARVNPFAGGEVAEILRERGWLIGEASPEQITWSDRAAFLLGPQVADRAELGHFLALVFHYDAAEALTRIESHIVLSRYAARDVLRRFAMELLDGAPLTPDRFSEIITAMKDSMEPRGRELFHPIRLALTGQAGEGALDRVILLLDAATALPFAVPVKSARARILEFCSRLD
jgi:nondiscriminating glutamyl-tRNA synthetase